MKYFIHIYGCQMNYSDAERVSALLESVGFEKSLREDEADLVVIVACAVRESAVNRLFGNGKKFKRFRKENTGFKAVLTGCVVKEDRPKLEKIFDVIIDVKHIGELPARLGLVGRADGSEYFRIKPEYGNPYTAYVPIMTGCNNFCSYCIVPYTRGREYSRPVDEVLTEIEMLLGKGYKEIILLGQNVNSYHPDDKTDFPALLEAIDALKGDFWIRFLTSHPKDMTERLIKTVRGCSKCTNYIHLALQSGNDEVLSRMNRRYTRAHFMELVGLIREQIPEVMLTTDIIVGFPGETEAQFLDTASVMEEARFDIAYINKYSPRAGTVSAQLEDDVSWEEKKVREKYLNVILKKTALSNNAYYIDKTVDVLVASGEGRYLHGKTRSFKDIKLNKPNDGVDMFGKFVRARVIKATPWALEGEISQ